MASELCPKCNNNCAEFVYDEVDLGVGVLKHLLYVDCRDCGTIGQCPDCGAWDFQLCPKYCPKNIGPVN